MESRYKRVGGCVRELKEKEKINAPFVNQSLVLAYHSMDIRTGEWNKRTRYPNLPINDNEAPRQMGMKARSNGPYIEPISMFFGRGLSTIKVSTCQCSD